MQVRTDFAEFPTITVFTELDKNLSSSYAAPNAHAKAIASYHDITRSKWSISDAEALISHIAPSYSNASNARSLHLRYRRTDRIQTYATIANGSACNRQPVTVVQLIAQQAAEG
jgi:hypothetical protein